VNRYLAPVRFENRDHLKQFCVSASAEIETTSVIPPDYLHWVPNNVLDVRDWHAMLVSRAVNPP
jgi:hypothetical protein